MSEPDPISDHDPSLGLDLDALRQRLRAARAERGACPPWQELRADLLPGGARRVGREERLAHRELCPYCDAHIREWERSIDRTADTLEAMEKGVARGVVEGAKKILSIGKDGPAAPAPVPPPAAPAPVAPAAPAPPSVAPPPPTASDVTPTYLVPDASPGVPPSWNDPPPSLVPRGPGSRRDTARPNRKAIAALDAPLVPPPPPAIAAPAGAPPRPAATRGAKPAKGPSRSAPARPAVEAAAPLPLRLLVVEAIAPERIPPAVFLVAQALGAEVAHVPRIEELKGDPDLDSVCGIVFAGARPSEEWPEAVRLGRDLVPGRPVLVLAAGGSLALSGAKRALGGALLSLEDPAEVLLLALDPRL